jgi:hypothetical protein
MQDRPLACLAPQAGTEEADGIVMRNIVINGTHLGGRLNGIGRYFLSYLEERAVMPSIYASRYISIKAPAPMLPMRSTTTPSSSMPRIAARCRERLGATCASSPPRALARGPHQRSVGSDSPPRSALDSGCVVTQGARASCRRRTPSTSAPSSRERTSSPSSLVIARVRAGTCPSRALPDETRTTFYGTRNQAH